MIRCPMCGDACTAVSMMGQEAPIGFLCTNVQCDACGVSYTPEGFDADAWVAEWGTQWNTP